MFLSGGPRRLLLAVRGEVAKPERSDDGRSAGHSRSVPPERNNVRQAKPGRKGSDVEANC